MGLAARQALGRSSGFGIAYEKNQLSGFHGIMFPWKPTLSGSVEYHGPPCQWVQKLNLLNISVFFKLTYKFNKSLNAQHNFFLKLAI